MSSVQPLVAACLPALDAMPLSDVGPYLSRSGSPFKVACVNWPDRFAAAPKASGLIAHSGTAVYIDFFVDGNYLRAMTVGDGGPVHQDSCVEFFVEPTGELPYFNFEFNCIGTLHAACRSQRRRATPLSAGELASVGRFSTCGDKPFGEIEGRCQWHLTVAIPLAVLGLEYEGEPIAMRGNFYKCGDLTSEPHYLSWAPVAAESPDFHRPDSFAPIILA